MYTCTALFVPIKGKLFLVRCCCCGHILAVRIIDDLTGKSNDRCKTRSSNTKQKAFENTTDTKPKTNTNNVFVCCVFECFIRCLERNLRHTLEFADDNPGIESPRPLDKWLPRQPGWRCRSLYVLIRHCIQLPSLNSVFFMFSHAYMFFWFLVGFLTTNNLP